MRSALRISLIGLAILAPFAARETRRILRPEAGGALAGLIGSVEDTGSDLPRFPADPHGVLAGIQSISDDIQACRSPEDGFRGKLRLELTVEAAQDGDGGYVSGAWVRDAPDADDDLEACVASEIEKLRFTAPRSPLTVVTSLGVFDR